MSFMKTVAASLVLLTSAVLVSAQTPRQLQFGVRFVF